MLNDLEGFLVTIGIIFLNKNSFKTSFMLGEFDGTLVISRIVPSWITYFEPFLKILRPRLNLTLTS